MAPTPNVSEVAFVFGILGNIVSFLVYLAPVPTFYRIFKRKSTEGFQAIPYSVALFSAMLLLYYGFLKDNGLMIITINCAGCAIESFYLIFFMVYATREAKIFTTKMILLFNFGTLGAVVLGTYFVHSEELRTSIVGWICAVFSVCVFASPLSIMRLVIRTKSVEYMPFGLSFTLTICAVMWFFYGFLINDYYIAAPNVLGFIFGLGQMVLYAIYKDRNIHVLPQAKAKVQDFAGEIDLSTIEVEEDPKEKPEKLKLPQIEIAVFGVDDINLKAIQPTETIV